MEDVIVRLTNKFPCEVRGITMLDDDGNYNVYINSNLSNDMQYKAYQHELMHIRERHLDYDVRDKGTANEVEIEGHGR